MAAGRCPPVLRLSAGSGSSVVIATMLTISNAQPLCSTKKTRSTRMSEAPEKVGRVHHETHGHVLKIIIDNPAKKNSFSPEMMAELSEAMTYLDRDENL